VLPRWRSIHSIPAIRPGTAYRQEWAGCNCVGRAPQRLNTSGDIVSTDRLGVVTADDHGDDQLETVPATLDALNGTAFQPGVLVGKRYRIVSLLGRGAMGEVYRADDLKVGQPVALKFLPAYVARDRGRIARFVTEVRLARQISHPNICRVYDIDEAEGRWYLSMEYIDGETLASLLKRIGRLPSEKVLEIARQLCAGIAAAHDQAVLHRDLKPANIMIDGRGHVRISDFGLAVTPQSRTDGEIAGTPAYMAPEQLVGGPVTVRTDLFALGIMLVELLSGRRLFRAATVDERRLQRDADQLAKAAIGGATDARFRKMVLQCLRQDPSERPASARAVAAAIPGGADPVAAALAAGETPSPEMVAAADDTRRLGAVAAWSCLGAAITAVFIAAWQLPSMVLYRQIPLPKAPQALVERAQQVVTKAGYTDAPVDYAYWFVTAQTYGELASERSALYEPFNTVAASSSGTAVLFVYRQSPRFLVAQNTLGVVQYREPPADVPGMSDVTLDPLGRLVRFTAVPKPFRGSRKPHEPDWSTLFSDAGLDFSAFTRVEATAVPSVVYDTLAAWEGTGPAGPADRIRVTAAALDGRLVAFDATHPLAGDEPFRSAGGASQVTFIVMTVAALFGAGMLARWNMRQGRWDRTGALRLAGYMFVAGLVISLLRADHVPIVLDEYLMFARIVGWNLYSAVFTLLVYVAFEPLVRRRWPQVLTSWTRILSGRPRDPLVGRDILIGALAGSTVTLVREAEFIVWPWLGFATPSPFTSTLDGLGSWQQFASLALFVHVEAMSLALGWLMILVLLRIALRRNDFAIVAAVLLVLPLTMRPGDHLFAELALGLLVSALSVFVLLRFGLVALVVEIAFANAFTRLPVTLNSSDWYVGRSAVVLLCLVGLIGYGFHVAAADRPLVGRRLVEE
jgi:hypothetical protein